MGTATVEVSGAQATQWAAELHAVLTVNAQPGDKVSPVEVARSAEMVIAVIGLVFAGVGTAKTIWDWWHSRRQGGVTVTILLSDGTRLNLSDVSQDQLEIVFRQDESQ
ncbi:hypothetical protein DQE82_30050 [Micromonospora sp. LHW51205]|uniref:hypothetical protein n=1 Tax=unclassified Micromonospora TaxID=2617518 RepID=UPI000DEBCAA9|nr:MULTISPECIES: hypothetical protein [unclassified Micromonospora]RBQ03863.1 hypothetical protein DQE82_30050 [Micromonospora sp. LHW51205]